MKYFLFSGSDYYPAGGAEDFSGVFSSIQAAKAYFAEHQQDWAHIAVFEDDALTLVCTYGPSWEAAREATAVWHDCAAT